MSAERSQALRGRPRGFARSRKLGLAFGDRDKSLIGPSNVHARFAEVALHEDGKVRRVGRVATKDLPALAESLGPEDHVVIEREDLVALLARLAERDPELQLAA